MKFSVIKEQRFFFQKNHWIECEGILSESQLQTLSREIPTVCTERLKTPEGKASSEQLFGVGRDLWRGTSPLKKIILSSGLAQIASELIEQQPLRMGYDQLFPPLSLGTSLNGVYATYLNECLSLEEISSIQGVLCGLMLCISEPQVNATAKASNPIPEELTEKSTEPSTDPIEAVQPILNDVFPLSAGNGIFFAPNIPIDFSAMKRFSGGKYLLIVYVKSNSVYYRQEKDPHLHHFKQLGYHFGDKLTEVLNPLVY